MSLSSLWTRCVGRYQRTAAAGLARRPLSMRNPGPLISFTFDDFPRSALLTAGQILEDHGVAGTYYISLGLMAKTAPTGEMFTREDLMRACQRGHELGCHTFAHCHAYETPARIFEDSILENKSALRGIVPETGFKTLSYPIACPRPRTKRRCAKYFLACRGGGQTYNSGIVDLNFLKAFFIEQSRDIPNVIKSMIDATCRARGWLIFATHDVCENPTRYGCDPSLFSEIVRHSVESGARLLPVSEALAAIGGVSPIGA